MAVTGKLFNSLVFGGVNSADYGVYITGEAVYNAPTRAVEMVSVPGRNGDVPIDMGHWDNIEVTYPCGVFGDTQAEMSARLSDFRNAVVSQLGYQRLSDTYHPNEYRLGVYMSGIEFAPTAQGKAGEFDLKFNCKPQRFLTDGEDMIDIMSDWGNLKTGEGDIVTFEVDGGEARYTRFKSLTATIEPLQDLNGYDHPWVGGAGKNLFYINPQTLDGITISLNDDGSYTLNGSATNAVFLRSDSYLLKAGTYRLSASSSSSSGYFVRIRNADTLALLTTMTADGGNGVNVGISADTNVLWEITVLADTTLSNVKVYPQLELGTVKTAFEPYSNLCPISGWDSVEASVVGKNLFDATESSRVTDGVTFTVNDDGTVVANGTPNVATRSAFLVGSYTITDNTVLINGCPSGGASNKYELMAFANNKAARDNGSGSNLSTFSVGDTVQILAIVRAGYTANNLVFKPMIRLASETDPTYVPYQGTTHTATLPQTVYGGTVDLVSGVLTVDRAMVDLGTLNWSKYDASSDAVGTQSIYGTIGIGKNVNVEVNPICSNYVGAYRVTSNTAAWQRGNGTCSFLRAGDMRFFVRDDSLIDETPADFKTAMSGVQLVYELATPQTYQLTPQTIATLEGVNNVWASSGDVSVEYGIIPGVLINPTQYDSSPIIEVEGIGEFDINDYAIVIDDGEIGAVELADAVTESNQSRAQWRDSVIAIDLSPNIELLLAGDSFTIEKLLFTATYSAGYIAPSTYGTMAITSQPTNGTLTLNKIGAYEYSSSANISPMSFVKGVPSSKSDSWGLSTSFNGETGTSVFGVTVAYDGGATVTVTKSLTSTGRGLGWKAPNSSTVGTIAGISTKPTFSGQVIIDSETGDAYRYEDGQYISLNKYIQLGAQLPTLKPGANLITYDSTIESLKIAPRWWKL